MLLLALCLCVVASLLLVKIFLKLTSASCNSPRCLVGKTAVVTGGNSGIGYQVVLGLASRGCKVIIADKDNSERSCEDAIKHTENKNISWKHLDLASFESIRNFVKSINENEERLDILVNNAGVVGQTKLETKDGLNKHMQVNYLGHFLLTHLLTDILKKTAPSRVIFTSSIMAYFTWFHIDDLHGIKNVTPLPLFEDFLSYGNSKLCLFMTCKEFARRFKHTGITFNAVHPGLVNSNIFHSYRRSVDNKLLSILLYFANEALVFIASKTPKEGAETILKVALSKNHELGNMFMECRPVGIHPWGTDEQHCKEVWETTEKLVKLEDNKDLMRRIH